MLWIWDSLLSTTTTAIRYWITIWYPLKTRFLQIFPSISNNIHLQFSSHSFWQDKQTASWETPSLREARLRASNVGWSSYIWCCEHRYCTVWMLWRRWRSTPYSCGKGEIQLEALVDRFSVAMKQISLAATRAIYSCAFLYMGCCFQQHPPNYW